MATRPKRPRDPFQLAKLIGDISTGQAQDEDPDAGKDPAAIALGRRGGLKGKGRWDHLNAEQRKELGRTLVYARWKKNKSGNKP